MQRALICLMALFLGTTSVAKKKNSPCSQITVDSITYSVPECPNTIHLRQGKGDTSFSFSIVPSKTGTYGFTVYGYGRKLPTYALISDVSSGGSQGTELIHVTVKNQYLPLGINGSDTTYEGFLPVHIWHGSETGRDTNFLSIPVTIRVTK